MRFKMFVFLFLSSIALSVAVYAGEAAKEHGHKSPHGGVVQETDGMHVEFLLDKNGEPKVFLYDKAMKPLERSDLQARLTKGEPIKGLTDWEQAVVSLKIKDDWSHVRFSHPH